MNPNHDAMQNSISQAFVLGGKSTFTVTNPSGDYHTYRVNVPPDDNVKAIVFRTYFVKVLTGPDNTRMYSYIGKLMLLSGDIIMTKASKLSPTDQRVRVVKWALESIWKKKPLPAGYSIKHAGRCGCCGRMLTTPESIERGIGPECWKNYK